MNKKEKHILALSGGKDSAALAVYLMDKIPELEYVFTDSGCELPETYEYIDRMEAILGIKVNKLPPRRSFRNWLQYKYGYLPSQRNRWCTLELKLRPYQEYLNKTYENHTIYSYVGLRADEESDREGFKTYQSNIIQCHPLKEDGLIYSDVENILKSSGLGFPKYYQWRSRSGCFFCFFQKKREWISLYKNHPDLFLKAQEYENIAKGKGDKFTWCSDMSLNELINKYNTTDSEAYKKIQKRQALTLSHHIAKENILFQPLDITKLRK
ncbi:MAG: phosphoadenosine phosphosulfate reductase family protein [Desulfamplus sp.]|nr:phosphoadenosine phosphosulfate reductase family protein [Desulfamplus sp.]